jgi:hypothetical protein
LTEIAIREMPAALKRLATLSNVDVVRPDFKFKASKLFKIKGSEKDHSQLNHEDWFLAGGEGTSSQRQDDRKEK